MTDGRAPSAGLMDDAAAHSIATQPSSSSERLIAIALVGVLAVASAIAVPYRLHAFAPAPAFIPGFAATTGTADLLAAVLLFGLYRFDGTRAVLAAATAYLFDALLIPPYMLTFPGVVTATGFIGNEQSAGWLWQIWHFAFPIILISGFLGSWPVRPPERRLADIARSAGLALLGAGAATYIVTAQQHVLPVIVHSGRFSALFTILALCAASANAGALVVLLWRARPLSTLQLWLAVALSATALDTALNGIAPARYSFGWYVGKADTFVTATVVLLSLLAAWSALYARSHALTQRLATMLDDHRSLQHTLDRERQVSLRLQEASLPRTLPFFDHVRLNAAYHPGSEEATIGGDWYDAFMLDDGRVAITIGDVMGSGLHAALTMTKLRQAMQSAAIIDPNPLTMLDVADRTLRLHDPDGYATALAMIYDPVEARASFASAGHLSPLLRAADGTVTEHSAVGTLLGVHVDVPRQVASVPTKPDTILVLYTDGIIEHSRNLLDGYGRLLEALLDRRITEAREPAHFIVERVLDGRKAADDIAVLTLSFVATAVPRAAEHDASYDVSR